MKTNQSTAAYSAVITSDPRKSRMKRLRKYRPLYLLALPAIVYLIVNNYFPMAGLILAFKNYSYSKGIFGSEWCGLKNFTYLFGSKWAGIMFRNTILYNLVFIFLGTLIAVVVAILLSEVRSARAQKLYQVIILIPYLMSTVLIGYLVFAFFSSDNGFINNSILKTLGLDPVKWYMKPDAWPGILIFVQMWRSFGFQSIVFFATILGFDKTLYESAVMDGASTWQQRAGSGGVGVSRSTRMVRACRSITAPVTDQVSRTAAAAGSGRYWANSSKKERVFSGIGQIS